MGNRFLQPILSAATAALFSCASLAGPAEEDLDAAFGEFSGCALILERDRHRERRLEYGLTQCALPLSPCSTFKIPNALIGLQEGVVSGPGDLRAWDGVDKGREPWNRDHTLASALSVSAVWYFQDLARAVGEPRMSQWLQRLEYGNADTSGGIDRFWLGNSLRINAHEQLDLLVRLTHGALPFREEHQSAVRHMLQVDSDLPGQLHGKTGSCYGDEERDGHGWFIGWVSRGDASNPSTTWFVVNIVGAGASGMKARPIALQLLQDFQDTTKDQ